MNSRDNEAIAAFKENHLKGIPAILKGTGRLVPAIHLYGRKHDGYGIGVIPIMTEREVPIAILRMAADKMFDELLCLSYSAEATMWKGALDKSGIDDKEMDDIMKDDPRILNLKKNAKPMDILWLTFETEQGTESKVYEVRKTGGSMVTAYGDLADDIKLLPIDAEFKGGHLAGRFANLFKKIKNYK